MARARILVGGVPGSQIDIVPGTTIQLDNDGEGGELTYKWQIADQPDGTTDSLSSTTIVNPQVQTNKEGHYFVRLTVNEGLPTESVDQVVLGVPQLKSGDSIPAAGESTEGNTARGWAEFVGAMLLNHDNHLYRGGVIMGVAGETLAVGSVCYVSGGTTLKSGLPGEEVVPTMSLALAASPSMVAQQVYVHLGTIAAGGTATAGGYALFRARGVYTHSAAFAGGVADDRVYVDDSGALALTAGSYRRAVGRLLASNGKSIIFDGAVVDGQDISFGLTTTGTGALDGFMAPGLVALAGLAVPVPVLKNGYITQLALVCGTQGHDKTLTATVYVDGVATAATVGLAAAGFLNTVVLAAPIAVSPGSVIGIRIVSSAALTTAGANIVCTVRIEAW